MDFLVGVALQSYTDGTEIAPSLKLQHEEFYIGLQLENPEIRELGQGLGDTQVYSLSVGYETPLTEKLYVFADVGYSYIDEEIKENIQSEVVYTRLVGRHNVEGAPIPTRGRPNRGETNGVGTEYDIEGGFTGRVGLKYRLNDLGFSVSYRHFRAKEFWKLYDEEFVQDCNCWWQETTYRDLSAVEFKIEYTWL